MINMNYVKWIQDMKITLFCEDEANKVLLKKLGAKKKLFDKNIWNIYCTDNKDLAVKLQVFIDKKFMFADGLHGWNPVDVVMLMKEKKQPGSN